MSEQLLSPPLANASLSAPPPNFPPPPPPAGSGGSWLLLLSYAGLGIAATVVTVFIFTVIMFVIRRHCPAYGHFNVSADQNNGDHPPTEQQLRTVTVAMHDDGSSHHKKPVQYGEVLLVLQPGASMHTHVAMRALSEAAMGQHADGVGALAQPRQHSEGLHEQAVLQEAQSSPSGPVSRWHEEHASGSGSGHQQCHSTSLGQGVGQCSADDSAGVASVHRPCALPPAATGAHSAVAADVPAGHVHGAAAAPSDSPVIGDSYDGSGADGNVNCMQLHMQDSSQPVASGSALQSGGLAQQETNRLRPGVLLEPAQLPKML